MNQARARITFRLCAGSTEETFNGGGVPEESDFLKTGADRDAFYAALLATAGASILQKQLRHREPRTGFKWREAILARRKLNEERWRGSVGPSPDSAEHGHPWGPWIISTYAVEA